MARQRNKLAMLGFGNMFILEVFWYVGSWFLEHFYVYVMMFSDLYQSRTVFLVFGGSFSWKLILEALVLD